LERVVTMMSEGQGRARVHIAAVVTPADAEGHPFIARVQAAAIPVTPIVVGGRNYLGEYRSLADVVTRFRPEVIHTHGYREDVIGGLIARAHRIPAVSTVHGFTGGGARNRLNENIQLLALRRADAVIAVSRPLVGRLVRAGVRNEKIHFLANGFAPPASMIPRAAARRMLGLTDNALVAGWVGRLSHEKGADVMLNALAQCDASWRLSVIGEGPEGDRLRAQAADLGVADRVVWHGAVAKAGELLSAFDAFVLSSRTEGTPIVLLEAMHAGVPILATTVGGVPDVVTSDHALLVSAENPGAIAEGLALLRREPAAAIARTTQARSRVAQSFSADAWIDAIEDVYRRTSA
jgi:glycosyltransferase involved in cell wall biosynthesis